MGVRKILNLFLTAALCAGIVFLGAGTAFRVRQMLQGGAQERRAAGSGKNDHSVRAEAPADHPALLADLCGRLEQELGDDKSLHVYSMLQAPGEYGIWETLSGIGTIGESGLSDEEWLLRQKLCWSWERYEEACQLPDYSSVFSELTGVLNKMPEVFYTWHFETGEDVEAYGKALEQIPGLLGRLGEQLKRQELAGLVYPQSVLEGQIQSCERQLAEESVFLEDYARRVRACDFLSDEEKESFIAANRGAVETYVWEPYRALLARLKELRPAEECRGLGAYPEGKRYYEHLLKLVTGSALSADEMYAYLEEKRELVEEKLSGMEAVTEPAQADLYALSAEEILSMLYGNMTGYPGFSGVAYVVEEIPEKLDARLYQAFYMRDDRSGANYIYIGRGAKTGTWLSLYQTLAHEALPGHMYCYNFPGQVLYPRLQGQLKCMGYSEGWALFAERSAADWLTDRDLREAYIKRFYEKLYDEIVLSQIDIGIHALGWTLRDTEDFSVRAYGAGSREASEAVMETLSQNPCAYQPYVMGYFEIEELQSKYGVGRGISQWEFIEAYMWCGQAPFWIVDAYMGRIFGAQAYEMS